MNNTYVKLTVVSLIWGGGFIAGKVLMTEQLSPYTVAFTRFVIGASFLLLVLYRTQGQLPRLTTRQWGLVGVLGMSGIFLYNIFFFNGLRYITASRASLIVAITPVVVTLGSALFFKEKITWLRGLGIGLSLVGAALVITHGNPLATFRGGLATGDWLTFGCVVTWTVYTLVGKIALRELNPLTVAAYSAAVGCVALAVPALWQDLPAAYRRMDWQAWASIGYLGLLGTGLTFTWFYEGVRAIGASKAAVFGNLVPVFAVLLAVLVRGESVDEVTLAGGALVLCGVALTNR